jgi:two-component system sensor histidine kinase KdpD
MDNDTRPDPDELLSNIKKQEVKELKGKLKIYFGMCAGVGKTYAMLQDANRAAKQGEDIVIGYVETHKRAETDALLTGLPLIPRVKIIYNNVTIEEMDIDSVIQRNPGIAVVDELAHSNAPGSRHTKRYLDVLELLDLGIDVYTTVNVQHLESRSDAVAQITGVKVYETVPDSILEIADEIELIDISPEELLERLAEGKVYTPERSEQAVKNFFRRGNLTALREMALRLTAERVDRQLRVYMQEKMIKGPWKSSQRIMVAVGPSPLSANLIRYTRGISYANESSWIAVNVDTGRNYSSEEKRSLNKNMNLARQLGAEIISTSDTDIAKGILRIGHKENVTQIIVGKTNYRTFFQKIRGKGIVDRLIQESGDIDINVVGGKNEEIPGKRILNGELLHSKFLNYLTACGIVALTAIICYPLTYIIGYTTVSLILLFIVTILPIYLSRGPVLAAATLAAVIWDFFFIPPRFTLSIARIEDVLMLSMFFIISIVTSVLTSRIRTREKAVRKREESTFELYNLAFDLSRAHNLDDVLQAAVKNINSSFNAETAILLSDSSGILFNTYKAGSIQVINQKEWAVASWVFSNGKKAGKFTDSLPSSELIYYPLKGPRNIYGVVGVNFKNEAILSVEEENLLENFVIQIGAAVEREKLNEKSKESLIVEESEKLYKNIFNSISHELKTPIAAIMGSVEYLKDSNIPIDKENQLELYSEIYTAAERLNRLVENLLDMTRLEAGRINLNLTWCDVSDIFSDALKSLKRELKDKAVNVVIAPNMPLIKVDYVLTVQAIKNIIYNAAIYNPPGIEIELRAACDDMNCYLQISDNGKGIPGEDIGNIFEKFYRSKNTPTGGTGLGLSIAKGFVEALDGVISAKNNVQGGAEFTIEFPRSKEK